MKKAVAALLCFVLVFSMIGCGTGPTPEQEETFKKWVDTISGLSYIISNDYANDVEGAEHVFFFSTIGVLVDETEKVIGIPEAVFVKYDDIFSYDKSKSNRTYATELSIGNRAIDIEASTLKGEISRVKFSLVTEDEKPYQITSTVDNLIEEFGEPSGVYDESSSSDELVESTVTEAKKRLETEDDVMYAFEWNVSREDNKEFVYIYTQSKLNGRIYRYFSVG